MPVFYLKHEKHGQKVETNEVLAKADRANGWVLYDPSEAVQPAPAPVVIPEEEPEVPAFLAPVPKPAKRGRPTS